MYVTSFSIILYCSNSEYWTQKLNSLRLTFFGNQQLGNGLEIEGDLMQINIYQIILYEVKHPILVKGPFRTMYVHMQVDSFW